MNPLNSNTNSNTPHIDFIGDIHGYAAPLKALLTKLGYTENAGVWAHPSRKACFLGDYIDRGDAQLETIHIVKGMVEAGSAYAIMGNHELNAIGWLTKAETGDDYLRPHTDKNRKQHSAFLDQLSEGSKTHTEAVAWFYTLPLWLDFGGIRVVHACWHEPSMAALKPYLTDDSCINNNCIKPEHIQKLYIDDALFAAVEVITKGVEVALPKGYSFADKDGHVRTNIRLKWWRGEQMSYREAAVIPEKDRRNIPDIPLKQDLGYHDDTPVLFGHYWMAGTPRVFNPQAACLDWSIAAKGAKSRKLCAYRWQGEAKLSDDNLVWVELG